MTVHFYQRPSTLTWLNKTKMTSGCAIDRCIFTRIHGREASIISFSFWDSISQTQVQAFFNFKIEPNDFLNTNMFKLKQHEHVLELVTKRTFGEPIPIWRTVSHSGEHLSNRFLVINKSFLILNEISFFKLLFILKITVILYLIENEDRLIYDPLLNTIPLRSWLKS